jgi:ParB-like nuclease domain
MPPRVTTKMIGLAGIAVSDRRLRKIRPETVDELAESILQQGLLHPIRLRPRSHNGSGYILIAGQHRLEAARKLHKRKLGPDHIRAEIVDDLDANAALLAEIDENLLRADLSPIERALHVARRKELYELEHPKTVHGGDRKRSWRKKSRSQNENLKKLRRRRRQEDRQGPVDHRPRCRPRQSGRHRRRHWNVARQGRGAGPPD